MAFKEYGNYDAVGLADLVRKKQVSARELLDEAIARTAKVDPQINAVVVKHYDYAKKQVETGLPDGPFTGVPFLLKDLWASYAGQLLSNGNRALKEAAIPSPQDTTLVARFRRAGFVTAGRTNSPEFGSLPTTEPEAWGPTRNPWNLDHSTGGSSGGSAGGGSTSGGSSGGGGGTALVCSASPGSWLPGSACWCSGRSGRG